MGFFDKLKSAVGIGQPKLEINVSGSQFNRMTPISGTIVLTGKDKEVPIKSVKIEMVEVLTKMVWSESQKKQVEEKKEQVIGKVEVPKNDYMLKPNEVLSVPFELVISNAMVSGYPWAHKLKASADLPGLDPSAKLEVFIS